MPELGLIISSFPCVGLLCHISVVCLPAVKTLRTDLSSLASHLSKLNLSSQRVTLTRLTVAATLNINIY